MKLATFQLSNQTSFGIVNGDTILDVGSILVAQYADLKALIAKDGLETARIEANHAPVYRQEDLTLLPPIINPQKIICVGLNYEDHRKETGRPEVSHPTLFLRLANTQIGHQAPMLLPNESSKLDYEGELAVVIGKGGRRIPEEKALDHVFGYSCYNDGSIRDWQRHTSQFTPGKNFPCTGSFGPWLVTVDEVSDPGKFMLTTRLNGEIMQSASTDRLIFSIPALINYISTFTKLEPGDIIVSGTPGGVGSKRNPPIFMRPGDFVEVEISDIGSLGNPIQLESTYTSPTNPNVGDANDTCT